MELKNMPARSSRPPGRADAGGSATSGHRDVLLALSWYYPEIHRGVARFARDHAWHVTFDFDDPIPKHWNGDGVLTLLGVQQDLWRRLRKWNVPIVDLAESCPDIPLPRVTMDNAEIARMAAEYFLDRGYRQFAFVHRWELGVSRRRREHFRAAIESRGFRCSVLSWQQERRQRADTREQRQRWLPLYVPPAGIVERRSTDSLATDHPQVAVALRFIRDNADRQIGMIDIVKHVAMSRSGLEKAFREHYVRAPMEELRQTRLARAKKLLHETDEKVAAISQLVGFQTPQSLCRIFRRQLGVTPKQYRTAQQAPRGRSSRVPEPGLSDPSPDYS